MTHDFRGPAPVESSVRGSPRLPRLWLRELESRLAGRFEFQGLLGRGGYAAVFRVRNRRLGRLEALKVLFESHATDDAGVQRFLREIRAASSVDHPHVVKIFDFGDESGLVWYSMQLLDGPTASQLLMRNICFPVPEVVRCALELLDALQAIHGRSIVHRDLKPSNVGFDLRGRSYLMDFGIARLGAEERLTRTGTALGTPAYLAPEILRGQPFDGRADLYSLAVTLFEMLTGRLPFRTQDTASLLVERLLEPPLALSEVMAQAPSPLTAWFSRALATDVQDRFPSAAAMADGLRRLAANPQEPKPRLLADLAAIPVGAAPMESLRRTTSLLPGEPRIRRAAWAALAAALLGLATLSILEKRETADSVPISAGPASPASAAPGVQPPTPVSAGGSESEPSPPPSVSPPTAAGPRTAGGKISPQSSPRPGPVPPRRPATPPLLLASPVPELSGTGLEGRCEKLTIPLSLEIDAEGQVQRAEPIGRTEQECAKLATSIVRNWRFSPARDAEGRGVPARTVVALEFSEAKTLQPEDIQP